MSNFVGAEAKLYESGYKSNEITKAKRGALKLDYQRVLIKKENIEKPDENETRILTFVINHDVIIKAEIKKYCVKMRKVYQRRSVKI